MKIGTKVIRAGLAQATQGEPFLAGVTFAGTYHASGDTSTSPYTYGRYHNPTWTQFERALSELEGGAAVSFASGMAAVAAVFGTTLRAGDVLVMPSDSYYTARLLADGFFTEIGVKVRKAPIAGDELSQLLDGAKLLWLETPANPGLDVCDIAALVDIAHKQDVPVAVDNTTPTVLGQNPLELGADFSVASDTKVLTGHADLILGHVAVRDAARADKLLSWRTQIGAVPGPMEVWLAHRSLATLEMRVERQCRNAQTIAEYLTTRSEVAGLRYPGLPQDPSHRIAAQQMRFYGQIVSFVLADRACAERFLQSCKLVFEATSFGGVQTTAERRARWGGDEIPEGFIRLSVGCEDGQDLVDDLAQALSAM
ncbi:MAG: cystathionine gamma-lyase [Acidobacteriota bacterium]|nr:cystathionine gamma-lyase [Acidobacteriota bacterium]